MTEQSNEAPELAPCRCGRKAMVEEFHDDDDPQPLFVATCEVCPVQTYEQFTAAEAARIWNEFVGVPSGGVPNGALVELLNAALLHPGTAEGHIRQVIEVLSQATIPTPTSEPKLPRIKETMLDEIQDCDKCDLCEDHYE